MSLDAIIEIIGACEMTSSAMFGPDSTATLFFGKYFFSIVDGLKFSFVVIPFVALSKIVLFFILNFFSFKTTDLNAFVGTAIIIRSLVFATYLRSVVTFINLFNLIFFGLGKNLFYFMKLYSS